MQSHLTLKESSQCCQAAPIWCWLWLLILTSSSLFSSTVWTWWV
jgi:hypothetical protein